MSGFEILMALAAAMPQTVRAIEALTALIEECKTDGQLTDAQVSELESKMLAARDDWFQRRDRA